VVGATFGVAAAYPSQPQMIPKRFIFCDLV
jgi:hypothetical protein